MEQALLENRIGRFAICEQTADCFEYWIAGLYRGGAVPEGLKLYSFPESDWAVFSAKGPLPGSLQTLNTYIWQTWYPAEGQQVVGNGAAALLGAFISDGAVGSVAGMPAVQRGLPALQTRDLCRQARLAGINYTCEAGEKSHELQDHR